MIRFGEYALSLGLLTLAGLAAISKLSQWPGMPDHPRLTSLGKRLGIIFIISLVITFSILINTVRGHALWSNLLTPSVLADSSSEIVALLHSRARVLPSGNTEVYTPQFQDLWHDWKISLMPHGIIFDLTVFVQDQTKPDDKIQVAAQNDATITGPRAGWISGFDEPYHTPDFFVRTVNFKTLDEAATITIRRPVKSRNPAVNTVTSLDLDLERIVRISAGRCNIRHSPIVGMNKRFEILTDQLRVLALWKGGPDASQTVVTRMNPEDPLLPLEVNGSELITEARCKDYPCKNLLITLSQHSRSH
jgi:hypothetical protein